MENLVNTHCPIFVAFLRRLSLSPHVSQQRSSALLFVKIVNFNSYSQWRYWYQMYFQNDCPSPSSPWFSIQLHYKFLSYSCNFSFVFVAWEVSWNKKHGLSANTTGSDCTILYSSEQPDAGKPDHSLSHEFGNAWISKRTNECSGAYEWSYQYRASMQIHKWVM